MRLAAAPRRQHAAAVSPAAACKHKPARLCVAHAAAASISRSAVGIDLGTTNSVVAVLREGETYPTVIRTSSSNGSSSSFTIPSVVAYQPGTSTPLVGAAAKQQAAANPSNSFYSVKRLMGRSWQKAQSLGLLYGVQEAADGGVELLCPAQGTTLSPQQVSRLDRIACQPLLPLSPHSFLLVLAPAPAAHHSRVCLQQHTPQPQVSASQPQVLLHVASNVHPLPGTRPSNTVT
jgi:molecular chaperone DnaK